MAQNYRSSQRRRMVRLVTAAFLLICWSSLSPRRNQHGFVVGGVYALAIDKPVLVVGATGKVGRQVVQKLMAENRPVRALVRNPTKAQEIFGTKDKLEYPRLEIVVADLGRYEEYEDVLDRAVQGCSGIISVMGAIRFSKLTDFLPWRLFRVDVSSWAGRDHPYYGNYLGQKKLIELAEKHNIPRFIRLTGLGLANSAFSPFSILFNTLLSCNNRYGLLCEKALGESKVPYIILRPGGLAENARNSERTNLQIDPSGKLPFPSRIGRGDVADLCVQACKLATNKSYILACRWCGDDIQPKPQGQMSDGYATAKECLEHLVVSKAESPPPSSEMKPYSVAVALVVYPLVFLAAKTALALWFMIAGLVSG